MMLASALLGRHVQSAAGDNLGAVDDFVIDLTSGNVPFALVSYGGFLGIGQDQAPVPLSAFSVNLEDTVGEFDKAAAELVEARAAPPSTSSGSALLANSPTVSWKTRSLC